MKLTLSARKMLIARMQVYVYENVQQGKIYKAEKLADETLESFDSMMEESPATSAGFWAGRYFDSFVSQVVKG